MARRFDPEPKRCAVCDVRLSRVEPDHEDKHIRAEQAKALAAVKKDAEDGSRRKP